MFSITPMCRLLSGPRFASSGTERYKLRIINNSNTSVTILLHLGHSNDDIILSILSEDRSKDITEINKGIYYYYLPCYFYYGILTGHCKSSTCSSNFPYRRNRVIFRLQFYGRYGHILTLRNRLRIRY